MINLAQIRRRKAYSRYKEFLDAIGPQQDVLGTLMAAHLLMNRFSGYGSSRYSMEVNETIQVLYVDQLTLDQLPLNMNHECTYVREAVAVRLKKGK